MTYKEVSDKIQEHYSNRDKCQTLNDIVEWNTIQAELFKSRKQFEDISYAYGMAIGPEGVTNYTTYSDLWWANHMNWAKEAQELKTYLANLGTELQESYGKVGLAIENADKFAAGLYKSGTDKIRKYHFDIEMDNGCIKFELKRGFNPKPLFAILSIYFYPDRIRLVHSEYKNRNNLISELISDHASIEDCLNAHNSHTKLKYNIT